jgi:hypothetical protein
VRGSLTEKDDDDDNESDDNHFKNVNEMVIQIA